MLTLCDRGSLLKIGGDNEHAIWPVVYRGSRVVGLELLLEHAGRVAQVNGWLVISECLGWVIIVLGCGVAFLLAWLIWREWKRCWDDWFGGPKQA